MGFLLVEKLQRGVPILDLRVKVVGVFRKQVLFKESLLEEFKHHYFDPFVGFLEFVTVLMKNSITSFNSIHKLLANRGLLKGVSR